MTLLPASANWPSSTAAAFVLFNIDGSVSAPDNSCPHNGASLASGQLEGRLLRCPAHGLRFECDHRPHAWNRGDVRQDVPGAGCRQPGARDHGRRGVAPT